jgi:uncharacterized protein YbjT (DUF2867 family)
MTNERPPDPIGKGAPDPIGDAPQKIEQLGGPLDQTNTEAARELQEVFGRRVVVVRRSIGRRFRTRAPR